MNINTKVITPTSREHWLELRANYINSTEVSTLFGLNPYSSKFQLWHEKKSKVSIGIEENFRMKMGSLLEAPIAQAAADQNGWVIHPMKDYYCDDTLRIGSSMDYRIENPKAILEIKNVDSLVYKKKWSEFESTPMIELQVQHQMLLSGYDTAYICALVGGNELKIIERHASPEIQKDMLNRVSEFWKSIEDNEEPKIDYERDAELLIAINQMVDPGTFYSGPTDQLEKLVIKYKELGLAENKIKADKTSLKAQMMEIIGDKEKVKHEKFSISLSNIAEQSYTVNKKSYRDFRVFVRGKDENL